MTYFPVLHIALLLSLSTTDNEDPIWANCPENITQAADPGTNSAQVSWDAPTVSDNSGEATITDMPAETEQHFSGGTWPVIYRAVDTSNNEALCVFYVTVTGKGIVGAHLYLLLIICTCQNQL